MDVNFIPPKVLVIVSSLFLLASIIMLILSTVPEFQVKGHVKRKILTPKLEILCNEKFVVLARARYTIILFYLVNNCYDYFHELICSGPYHYRGEGGEINVFKTKK